MALIDTNNPIPKDLNIFISLLILCLLQTIIAISATIKTHIPI